MHTSNNPHYNPLFMNLIRTQHFMSLKDYTNQEYAKNQLWII